MQRPRFVDEFKNFITQGNVIQLAIAFVMGAAFTGVVTAFTSGLVNPLIGVFGGMPNLSSFRTTIGSSTFLWGTFLTAVINFLIVAAILFFFVVYPLLRVEARRKARLAALPPTTKECPYCLSTIPIKATRCANCTSALPGAGN